jgi:hypothetical protein
VAFFTYPLPVLIDRLSVGVIAYTVVVAAIGVLAAAAAMAG